MIRIPGELGWTQNNKGDGLGTINESFNLDLSSNVGKVRLTRTKRIAYTDNPSGFGEIAAMEEFDNELYVAAERLTSGDDIWKGTNLPFEGLTRDSTSIEISPGLTDLEAWNAGLYASAGQKMMRSTDGVDWTEIGSSVLSVDSTHLLTAKNDVLYVSDSKYKVKSITSGNSFQGTGSQTLNLALPGYVIQFLETGTDTIWVGLSNLDGAGNALVFEWDGESENAPAARYSLNAPGVMAGVVKDGVPYIVDSSGRLLVFNGGTFVEVARFPLNGGTFLGFNSDTESDRAIHPKGMAVDGDEILITVANHADAVSEADFNNFPSGVWAYSDATGLYHKYSACFQAVADSGTTNLTDHGQFRAYYGGPMMVFNPVAYSGSTTDDLGGRVLFSLGYFPDADSTAQDVEWGLFGSDERDETQKAGWLTSPRILSSEFRDHWQEIYTALSDLITSGDLVEIKYRVKDEVPTYATATWNGTDRFSTNTDLAAYEQGDEITIVQGKGSGAVAHARELTSGAGSEVILDRDIAGVSGTSVVRIEKWKKVGKIEDFATKGFTIGEQAHWVQIKVHMRWTGKRELYGILIKNASSLS